MTDLMTLNAVGGITDILSGVKIPEGAIENSVGAAGSQIGEAVKEVAPIGMAVGGTMLGWKLAWRFFRSLAR